MRIFIKAKGIYLLYPLIVYLLVLFVYPLFLALIRSFFDPRLTLTHYIHFFSAPVYFHVIINTFKIATTVTLFCLLLGYPFAYLLSSISPKMSNRLMIIVLLPFWVSLLVRTYAWMVLLGREGVINSILMGIGLTTSPIKLIYNAVGVNVGMVHILLPYMILNLYSVMKGIDRNLLKASENLGANRVQTFVRVFFPLSLPGVGGGCLIVFVMAIGFFITPALLGGTGDIMISQLIEAHVTTLLNWGFAFCSSFILLGLTVLILMVYNRFLGLDKLWGGV
jgi:ABC-type spermidine/putrescine transport system permease subunit I